MAYLATEQPEVAFTIPVDALQAVSDFYADSTIDRHRKYYIGQGDDGVFDLFESNGLLHHDEEVFMHNPDYEAPIESLRDCVKEFGPIAVRLGFGSISFSWIPVDAIAKVQIAGKLGTSSWHVECGEIIGAMIRNTEFAIPEEQLACPIDEDMDGGIRELVDGFALDPCKIRVYQPEVGEFVLKSFNHVHKLPDFTDMEGQPGMRLRMIFQRSQCVPIG